MAYQFTKDLETGNAIIDEQHRQLLGAINVLLEACASGKGRALVNESIRFLSDYTARHFADEERLQQQGNYPGYLEHKRSHDGFKEVVAGLVKRFEAEGPTIVLVGEVNFALANWLINHIKREDTKVAAHLRANNS